MGNTPSLNDRFARRAAPVGKGFGPAQDHFRKGGPDGDPFKSGGKPPKPPKIVKPAEPLKAALSAVSRQDPFAPRSKPAQPAPAPKPAAKAAPKPAPRPAMTVPLKDPFARVPLRPLKTRTPSSALAPGQPAPKATAARVAPAAASFYNPFGRSPPPRGDTSPAPVESPRPPLHVVPDLAPEPAAPVKKLSAALRPAGRSSSLVLVSGATAAAETLEAPPPPSVDKAPELPAADPLPSAPLARKRAGGGGTGDGPPRGGATAVAAPARQGFTQDDLFGVIFGIAVILFLLLWLMRGRSEEAPSEDGLAGVQSVANQQLAAAPPPAPLIDPFGNAPVDLRPTGPIPGSLPEPDAGVAAAPAPQAATPAAPPKAAIAPALLLPERKMNGWFCTASSKLTKASRTALEAELTTFADVFAGKELVVRGYADTRGSSDYNSLLGAERAKVVADFLRTNGLTVAEFSGVGELDGLDDNQNCPNQRRVDVWVKGGTAAAPSRECAPEPEVAGLVCG
jgi:outer membrane protein OmpA-like peptidoglycan-associated protein